MKKENTTNKIYSIAIGIFFFAYAIGFGILTSVTLLSGFFSFPEVILGIAGIVVSYYLAIIIHEGGHLVFGLLAGYSFSSFRIFSLMWARQDGRIRLRRFSLAGTGGQCLMIPPESDESRAQTLLYNFGGVIANVILAAILALLYYLTLNNVLVALIFLLGAAVSFYVAITNGIPFNAGGIANDGMNAIQLMNNPDARDALRKQLLMNAAQLGGTLTADMPDEWFTLPDGADMQNLHCSSIAVFAAERHLDRLDTTAAEEEIKRVLDSGYNILGLHRSLLTCDLITCRLINGDSPDLSAYLTPELDRFMKSMRTYPSVIRTQYAIALLVRNDERSAEKILLDFEKTAKKHPYPCNIEVERGIIAKILKKHKSRV